MPPKAKAKPRASSKSVTNNPLFDDDDDEVSEYEPSPVAPAAKRKSAQKRKASAAAAPKASAAPKRKSTKKKVSESEASEYETSPKAKPRKSSALGINDIKKQLAGKKSQPKRKATAAPKISAAAKKRPRSSGGSTVIQETTTKKQKVELPAVDPNQFFGGNITGFFKDATNTTTTSSTRTLPDSLTTKISGKYMVVGGDSSEDEDMPHVRKSAAAKKKSTKPADKKTAAEKKTTADKKTTTVAEKKAEDVQPKLGGKPWLGATVVFTGNLQAIPREEAALKVQSLLGAAKVTSAVSSKTDYLVIGHVLEDGRKIEEGSKYRKMQSLKDTNKHFPKVVTEDELQALFDQEDGKAPSAGNEHKVPVGTFKLIGPTAMISPEMSGTVPSSDAFHPTSEMKMQDEEIPSLFGSVKRINDNVKPSPTNGSSKPSPTNVSSKPSPINDIKSFFGSGSTSAKIEPVVDVKKDVYNNKENVNALFTIGKPMKNPLLNFVNSNEANLTDAMWVDKHKPRLISELVGNQMVVSKLKTWLTDWKRVVLKGEKKPVNFKPGRGAIDNVNARACLVSGPPGIGKTSAAHLICNEMGLKIVEFNASDTRGKRAIEHLSATMVGCRPLTFGSNATNALTGKAIFNDLRIDEDAVIIMDEVDGMAGNQDRGGNAALIQMIKKSKIPIICICNDRMNPKVRSLANSCYDLKFAQPGSLAIAKRVVQILLTEGVQADETTIAQVSESVGNDMRQVIHHYELNTRLMKQGKHEAGAKSASIIKDAQNMKGPFDVCKELLSCGNNFNKMSLSQRLDMCFVDADLIPLLVHQNYPKSIAVNTKPAEAMNRLATAAESIAFSDVISKSIRYEQNWSLMPKQMLTGCVIPSLVCNGHLAFPEFPQWLGKQSSSGKNYRLLREVCAALTSSTGEQRTSLSAKKLRLLGGLELIYDKIMKPLTNVTDKEGVKEAINESIDLIHSFGLSREMLQEHFGDLRFPDVQEDLYAPLDKSVKSSFTRIFNQQASLRPATVGQSVKFSKLSNKQAVVNNPEDEANEDESDNEDEFAEEASDQKFLAKAAASKKTVQPKSAGAALPKRAAAAKRQQKPKSAKR